MSSLIAAVSEEKPSAGASRKDTFRWMKVCLNILYSCAVGERPAGHA